MENLAFFEAIWPLIKLHLTSRQ